MTAWLKKLKEKKLIKTYYESDGVTKWRDTFFTKESDTYLDVDYWGDSLMMTEYKLGGVKKDKEIKMSEMHIHNFNRDKTMTVQVYIQKGKSNSQLLKKLAYDEDGYLETVTYFFDGDKEKVSSVVVCDAYGKQKYEQIYNRKDEWVKTLHFDTDSTSFPIKEGEKKGWVGSVNGINRDRNKI